MGQKERPIKVSVWKRKLPSGKTSFLLDINFNGKRTFESLHLITDKGSRSIEYKNLSDQAEAIAAQRRNELRRQRFGIDAVPMEDRKVQSYFTEFCESYKNKDIRKIAGLTKKVEGHFNEKLTLQALNKNKCEEFRDDLIRQLKKETARNYFQVFKRVLNKAVEESIIAKNPAQYLVIKAPNDRLVKNVLTKEELLRLVNTECSNNKVKRAFLFACLTGAGYKELKFANWGNILEENEELSFCYNRFKNQRPVKVHLVNRAIQQLNDKGKKQDLLFSSLPTNNGANKILKGWMLEAGIEKHITFYCARHCYGTLQAEQNYNSSVIALNMGHASTAHTAKYLNHLNVTQIEAAKSIEF